MLVDIVLVLVLVLAGWQGYRLGAMTQVVTYSCFAMGLYLGAIASTRTVKLVPVNSDRTAVALVTTLGVGLLLAGAGHAVASPLFRKTEGGPLHRVNAVLGIGVSVTFALLLVWLLASTLVNSSSETLNSSISSSAIVRGLDDALPAPPSVFSNVAGFLSARGFPHAFAGLAPLDTGPVELPGEAQLSAAATAAGPSTVKIVSQSCGVVIEGSGFVVASGLVVTNAHVVAGSHQVTVEDRNGLHSSTVVYFNPVFDMAVLRVDGLSDRPLSLSGHLVTRGTTAAVLGYPGGGAFTVDGAGVRAVIEAQGNDIYGNRLTTRTVYDLQSIVRPGNSGGPVIGPNGQVIGMVFSRSTVNNNVGYALTSPAIELQLERVSPSLSQVRTGTCVAP